MGKTARVLISERTVAGLAACRARGRKGGRPFKMTPPNDGWPPHPWANPTSRSATCSPNSASPAKTSTATYPQQESSDPTGSNS